MARPWLILENLTVRYGTRAVLDAVSFSLAPGEIGCLLGGSGTGKSTLLRAIAGFETPTNGRIVLAGQVLNPHGAAVPVHRRGVGMVFQDHALFPHLNVADNIAFGLQGLERIQREKRVAELLRLIDLSACASRYPHELSGGQQQRVALARALAPQPALVLLDEPFASLDTELRQRLAMEVRALLKAQNTAALLVTHDQQEAFAMADSVGLLADGHLQQWATPYVLYHEPVNRAVAEFIGEGVFLSAEVLSERCLQMPLGEFCRLHKLPVTSGTVDVLVRPDDVLHDDASPVRARLVRQQFRGAEFLCTLALDDGTEVLSLMPSHHVHANGEYIGIRVNFDHLIAFPRG
jgi:iron(III) transport system ATP-binding protein